VGNKSLRISHVRGLASVEGETLASQWSMGHSPQVESIVVADCHDYSNLWAHPCPARGLEAKTADRRTAIEGEKETPPSQSVPPSSFPSTRLPSLLYLRVMGDSFRVLRR